LIEVAEAIAIRPFRSADLEPTRVIYNDAVTSSVASWDWEPVEPAPWQHWVSVHTTDRNGLFVAEAAGTVLGFAGFGPFRTKAGYIDTVEDSIYIRADARRRGIGTRLLAAALAAARRQGHHVMIAALASENTASVILHVKLGFSEVGCLPQVGQKFGRWLDLALFQCSLSTAATPAPALGPASGRVPW
jgi:phosphinothricin acetyltransferase